MPSLKSARAAEQKGLHNKPVRSAIKTHIRKAERLIRQSELESATKSLQVAVSALDKAAQKGIIHPNNAARRKSRLVRKFNQAQVQAKQQAAPQT